MKTTMAIALVALTLPIAARADVDCKQVMRELLTRTPEEVEISMRILRTDVDKCRKEADQIAERRRALGDPDARGGDTARPEMGKD